MKRKEALKSISIVCGIVVLLQIGIMLSFKLWMDNPYTIMILVGFIFSGINIVLFNILIYKFFKP